MQFLTVNKNTTLSELTDRVGPANIDNLLHNNQLTRTPDIGAAFQAKCREIMSQSGEVSWKQKSTILNGLVGDSDVFETAATLDDNEWKVLNSLGTLPNRVKIPETVKVPPAIDIIGNGIGIASDTYTKAMKMLHDVPHIIDANIFSSYTNITPVSVSSNTFSDAFNFSEFPLPWGDITIYSSLAGEGMDIPAYPEELSNAVKANYTTMPDLIYQYEPWNLYMSSGPRTCTYTFDLHRDMWGGDHRQGGANKLIRFCEANCYPEYNGSAVNTAIVTLYVKGSTLISGILTDVQTNFDGPIGQDGWYLHFKLELTFTEVSPEPLNFSSVRRKPLIG